MPTPWKEICAGCRHLNSQEPSQHCYMFRNEPESACMQHTETMDKATKAGKTVQLSELPLVVHAELSR